MKRKEAYESDSEKPAKKKYTKKSSNDDSAAVVVCELSKNRRVSVRNWQGNKMVDIREFYENKDGKQLPGKKGISLSMEQWIIVRDHVAEIDKVVAENS